MPNTCGLAVHNNPVSLGVIRAVTHSPLNTSLFRYGKARIYTRTFTHLRIDLCTIFTQLMGKISSVKHSFIHIIHIAYKEHDELKKGIN